MFDLEEVLTHEDILLRFKKVFGRDMTPNERQAFFLPCESSFAASEPDKKSRSRQQP
jgi:hypothetical protein